MFNSKIKHPTEPKKVIIVGATSGIGKSLTELYIQKNYHLGILGRRKSILEQIASDNENVSYEVCDVRNIDESINVLNDLYQKMRSFDTFILSSGVGWMNNTKNWDKDLTTIETNVKGWTALINWAYNKIDHQGYGQIVAITSIASIRGLAPAPSYSASKAYQAHYLEALRQKSYVSNKAITITEIRPGFVDTPLLADTRKFFWIISVDYASKLIYNAIERKVGVATISNRWKLVVPILRLMPNHLLSLFLPRNK